MKEKDPIGNQPELTGNLNSSKLGVEGDIFMTDEGGKDGSSVPPPGPEDKSRSFDPRTPSGREALRRRIFRKKPRQRISDADGSRVVSPEPAPDAVPSVELAPTPDATPAPEPEAGEIDLGARPPEGDQLHQQDVEEEDQAEAQNDTQDTIDKEAKKILEKKVKEAASADITKRYIAGEIDWETATAQYIKIHGSEDEQLREALDGYTRDKRTQEQVVADVFSFMAAATDEGRAKETFRVITGQISVIETDVSKSNFKITDPTVKAWYEVAHEILKNWRDPNFQFNLASLKEAAARLNSLEHNKVWETYSRERVENRNITQPEGFEEIIDLIVGSELPEWRPHGEKELQNEAGEVQMHNFMDWVREKVMYFHEFSLDSEISLFNDINIPTPYRQITLGEMIKTPRYFRKKAEDGGWVDDEHYTNLKEQILYEVWLFENNHNFEVKYRISAAGNEEKAVEALMGIHMMNIFTKDKKRLYNILTLPSADKEQIEAALKEGKRPKASVGQAIREALIAYNYIYEIGIKSTQVDGGVGNMFEHVLDSGNPEGTHDFYKAVAAKILSDRFKDQLGQFDKENTTANKKKKMHEREQFIDFLFNHHYDALISAVAGGDTKAKKILDLYKTNRNVENMKKVTSLLLRKANIEVVEEEDSHQADLEDLNIFGAFGKQPFLQDLVKEGIRNVFGRREKLSEQDARYAEAWAFSMTYWTGISARNDNKAQGFDGLSKMMNFKDYRVRQANGRGRFGDEETIYGGINKLALTMWEALRVVDEKTGQERPLLEVLQGGWEDHVDFSSPIGAFNFAEGSQQNVLAAQHYPNALNTYKFFMDEHGINYDSFLGRDSRGRLVVTDFKKADEVRSRYIKSLRYTFDMGNYYLDRRVRGWYQDNKGKIRVGGRILQEFMFGKTLREMGMYNKTEKSKLNPKLKPTDPEEELLFKSAYRPKTDEKGNFIDKDGSITTDPEKAEKVLKNMSRNIAAWTMAMELLKHRKFTSQSRRYGISDILMVRDFLLSMPIEIEEGVNPGEIKKHHTYFSKKQWKKVAKLGHASTGEVVKEEVELAFAAGGIVGLFDAIKTIAAYTIKQ